MRTHTHTHTLTRGCFSYKMESKNAYSFECAFLLPLPGLVNIDLLSITTAQHVFALLQPQEPIVRQEQCLFRQCQRTLKSKNKVRSFLFKSFYLFSQNILKAFGKKKREVVGTPSKGKGKNKCTSSLGRQSGPLQCW